MCDPRVDNITIISHIPSDSALNLRSPDPSTEDQEPSPGLPAYPPAIYRKPSLPYPLTSYHTANAQTPSIRLIHHTQAPTIYATPRPRSSATRADPLPPLTSAARVIVKGSSDVTYPPVDDPLPVDED